MRNKQRQIIATVDAETDPRTIEFRVEDARSITLTFPNAVYNSYGSGRSAFARTLTPDEARAIGRELIDAADRVTSAEHVNV